MRENSAKTKNSGASSACCTISIISAGRTRPIIRCAGAEILAAHGYPPEVIYAIKSHADYLPDCPRVSRLDKALYACDELAGFCTAAAMVRPEGIRGMQAASVRKKMKSKGFAAAVSRDDMIRGAADLGVDFDEHIQFVIDAMAEIAEPLGLVSSRSA